MGIQFINFYFSRQKTHLLKLKSFNTSLSFCTRFILKTVLSAQLKNQTIEQRNEWKKKMGDGGGGAVRTRHRNF